jgi:cytolysin-activating lysine-acyltransferase
MDTATAKEEIVEKAAGSGNGAYQAAARDGGGGSRPAKVAAKAAAIRPRDARQLRFAQSFANIVAVLMRDANFRKMRLADLEWLVLPPVMAGQYRLAQAPAPALAKGKAPGADDGGVLVPVAVALWARVSDSIDRQLTESLDKPVRLGPGDWASGDNVWLMAVAGDKRALPTFLDQLANTEFKGQRVKMRLRGPGDTVVVKTLGKASGEASEETA